MELVDALRKFNRKERYWLIRNALGPSSGKLEPEFLRGLEVLLKISIPEDAWWAMDYHLDWLVGALALSRDATIIDQAQPNSGNLVQGNQEDIDLVVAFGRTLILIEAKGDASWSSRQLNSKVSRLAGILEVLGNHESDLSLFFVLMSPHDSDKQKLYGHQAKLVWMHDESKQPYWMLMHMAEADRGPDFVKVVRCKDAAGTASKDGTFWKIVRCSRKA